MSREKAVYVLGRTVWTFGNTHDVVLAHLVEVAESNDQIGSDTLENWRVWASIPDIALTFEDDDPTVASLIVDMLSVVRERVVAAGDVELDDLADWSVMPGYSVCGFGRGGSLPVAAVLDVVDGLAELFAQTMPPDPDGAWWFLGSHGGRSTIPMRNCC